MNDILNKALEISNKCGIKITKEEVLSRYSESHRYWHTMEHLYEMLYDIEQLYFDKKLSIDEYHIFLMSAIFHDIVYYPKKHDNEEKSCDLLNYLFNSDVENTLEFQSKKDRIVCVDRCISIIMGTKTHDGKDALHKKFNNLDTKIIGSSFIEMLDWENKIYNEYKWVGWEKYKEGRIEFLIGCVGKYPLNTHNIKNLIDYVRNKKIKYCYYYYEIKDLDYFCNDKIDSLFDDSKIIIICGDENFEPVWSFKDMIEFENKNKYEEIIVKKNFLQTFLHNQKYDFTILKNVKKFNEYDSDIKKMLIENKMETIYI